jgi:hypothetical protein
LIRRSLAEDHSRAEAGDGVGVGTACLSRSAGQLGCVHLSVTEHRERRVDGRSRSVRHLDRRVEDADRGVGSVGTRVVKRHVAARRSVLGQDRAARRTRDRAWPPRLVDTCCVYQRLSALSARLHPQTACAPAVIKSSPVRQDVRADRVTSLRCGPRIRLQQAQEANRWHR